MIAPFHITKEMLAFDDKATSPKEPEPKMTLADYALSCDDLMEMHDGGPPECDTMHRGKDDDVHTWAMFHPQAMTRVKVRGEPLGCVLWHGTEWAVTDYGLECRDGRYHVRAKDLMARGGYNHRKAFNHWYQHIAEKSWVEDVQDLDFALQAFMLLYTSKGRRTGRKAGGINLSDAEVEEYANLCAGRAYESAIARARLGHIELSEFDNQDD